MLAAVLDEPEDAEPAVDLERVERDLGREERALLGSAGELDRGGPPVSQDAFEKLAQLGQLGRVDAGDRCLEQSCARVPEQCAAGVVGGEDAVVLGVHDVRGLVRVFEDGPGDEVALGVHRRHPAWRDGERRPQLRASSRRCSRRCRAGEMLASSTWRTRS